MLTLQNMSIADIQKLVDKENRRKQQCREGMARWQEKNKDEGTLNEKQREYNARHREKARVAKRAAKNKADTSSESSEGDPIIKI